MLDPYGRVTEIQGNVMQTGPVSAAETTQDLLDETVRTASHADEISELMCMGRDSQIVRPLGVHPQRQHAQVVRGVAQQGLADGSGARIRGAIRGPVRGCRGATDPIGG